MSFHLKEVSQLCHIMFMWAQESSRFAHFMNLTQTPVWVDFFFFFLLSLLQYIYIFFPKSESVMRLRKGQRVEVGSLI